MTEAKAEADSFLVPDDLLIIMFELIRPSGDVIDRRQGF